jgi:hypothetical protein
VVDDQGNPISWANVSLDELKLSAKVDDTGQAVWTDLSQGNVTLHVTAQGYAVAEEQLSLDRGPTEKTITLTRVPFGLLPSQACAPGETFLYAEDFQSGAVENWGSYPPGTPFPIEEDPTTPGNKVLSINFGKTDGEFEVKAIPMQDNVVRRFKYMPGNHSRFNTGFGGTSSYFIVLSADQLVLNFSSETAGVQTLAHGKPAMVQGIWHLLEFSSYNGKIEVWADGKLAASYEGATALTDGNILTIGSAFLPPDSVVRVDDVSICGLNAPFVPMPAAAP